MSRILVTGITSPLGQAVGRKLQVEGHRVVGTLRSSRISTAGLPADELVALNLENKSSFTNINGGFDAFVHVAAASEGTAEELMTITGLGTLHLVERAKFLSVGRIIHISSMAVYGQIEEKTVSPNVEATKPVAEKLSTIKASGSIDITALRRMWPEVIDKVKGKRRLTWSLLATSAQIISLDDENITIGIVNAGARDSFIRSESDVILSDAFEEVAGVRRKIVATVDTSVATTTMARSDEDPTDANMLSGADLLASKLGAKVIKESD